MERSRIPSGLTILLLGVLVVCAPTATAAQNVAFVTSVTGTGNLSSWPDAGGNTGLAAADAICQIRAAAGGLANPGDFVAWLSDGDDDAYCRIHGFAGKKSANCGRPNLPWGAGPWVRTDGYPFGNKINRMITPFHEVLAPIGLDEFGDAAPVSRFWTNTTEDGGLDIDQWMSCDDWTNATGAQSATVGTTLATAVNWTEGAPFPCSSLRALLCMAKGPGAPLPAYWDQGAKIFVTAAEFDGDLGNRDNATLACINRARDASVPGHQTFRAWLSDGVDDVGSFVSGLNFPFVRLDGIRVADNGADLLDAYLHAPINVTQYGDYLRPEGVWTGTDWQGNGLTDQHCFFWIDNSAAFNGWVGTTTWAMEWWTDSYSEECSQLNHLYCYSIAVIDLFHNDFDSGDTSAWTTVVP